MTHSVEKDAGYWDCSPDCERAYGGVHHGCRFVRPTRVTSPAEPTPVAVTEPEVRLAGGQRVIHYPEGPGGEWLTTAGAHEGTREDCPTCVTSPERKEG